MQLEEHLELSNRKRTTDQMKCCCLQTTELMFMARCKWSHVVLFQEVGDHMEANVFFE